jgi:hypothetical protein
MATPLIDLATFKMALGLPPTVETPDDDKFTLAVASASSMVRNFTGLEFNVSEEVPFSDVRQYEYDGSGFLDIDECQTVMDVSVQSGWTGDTITATTLSVNEWSAYPLNSPVKRWLQLAPNAYGVGSPEMGFTYNLDTLYWKLPQKPNIVNVTATWGWPEIPDDVKRATIIIADALAETTRPYTQESIENYSRTRAAADIEEAIPLRAQAILQNYIVPRL